MRASRLVSVLLLLQTRGRMTAQELAETLEVSVRTIYRDMESLSGAGVPVFGEPGNDGGYQLLDGYRTRLTGMTADEAQSLFLAGMPTVAADLGLTGEATAAQLKLMAALPTELRDRAGRVQERFHFDAPTWYSDADETPHLAVVADAVWSQRRLWMRYVRWAEPKEVDRTVDPYGLVLKAGRWYLVAHDSRQVRTYRVSRVLDLRILPDAFERPADFHLAHYWQESVESFNARVYPEQAVVRLSPRGMEVLPELMQQVVVRAARRSAEPPGGDGWVRVRIPIESVEDAVPELLQLGADAEVLEPPALRERMVEALGALNRIYGPP